MSATGVKIGYGTKVRVGRGNPVAWTPLIGLEDVSFPNAQSDEIETTHMESPNRTKEFIQGLNDNGESALTLHWIPGSPVDVLASAIKASGEVVQLEYTATNGGVAEVYAAFLKGLERLAPVNDKMTATLTFRILGQIVPEIKP